MRIQWCEKFATGNNLVDHQHKSLFEAIGEFDLALEAGLAPQRMDEMLAFLERYAREHFVTEEFLMVRAEFPDRAQHKAEHERLLLRVKFIRELRDQDPSLVPPEGLGKFLGEWLQDHILTWDLALFNYMKTHPVEG
jgi:hemerythrin